MSAAREPETNRPPREICGLRVSAVIETVVLIGAALAADQLLFSGDRFASVSPHPFWAVVLLIAAQYGTGEALFAAALSGAALLINNLPEQGFNEDLYAWLLRISFNPVLWCIAAVALGEIRAGHKRQTEGLQVELTEAQQQAAAIANAYEHLLRIKTNLEAQVAGQRQTVRTMYAAARAIERQSTNEVLSGIPEVVAAVLHPEKFSFFLLDHHELALSANQGWSSSDRFQHRFRAGTPLFAAIVEQQRMLIACEPEDAAILDKQGLLAGSLCSEETGEPFGMLKIEGMQFHELTPAAVQNFRILCEWIGAAFAQAQRFERLRGASKRVPLALAG
jgi:polysaccharide biosynthesis protein PelD